MNQMVERLSVGDPRRISPVELLYYLSLRILFSIDETSLTHDDFWTTEN